MKKKISLFSDIVSEEQKKMRRCLGAYEVIYQAGEIIMTYTRDMDKIGIIMEGEAVLYSCDWEGNQYCIENLSADSVFGEAFLFSPGNNHFYITAVKDTKVMFISYNHVVQQCTCACEHHARMVSNLFQMTAMKASEQTDRIYVLSRNSTGEKIMAWFEILARNQKEKCFLLPMSYTAMAEFLCVDRSAMMRALKNLSERGLICREGRKIEILKDTK